MSIAKDAPGETLLLMGNEAVARGALEAGVVFAASYPGTPASEIMDRLAPVAKELGIHAEWSVNEMVAVEAAAGVSMAGMRAMASMKQDGLMVAGDFLSQAGTVGIGTGAVVVVIGDDPSAWSSSHQMDVRPFAKLFHMPVLEPADPQEAKDMTKYLFDLSQECGLVCFLRITTRIGHGRGNVTLGGLPNKSDHNAYFREVHETRNPRPSSLGPFPPDLKYAALRQRLAKAQELAESSYFNQYEGPGQADQLILASGGGYVYAKEAVKMLGVADRVGILKIGTAWPLPERLLAKHLSETHHVLAVEEVSSFLEESAVEIADRMLSDSGHRSVYGRRSGHISAFGELNPDVVAMAVASILRVAPPTRALYYEEQVAESEKYLTTRPLTLCPGCPHRASFWAMKRALKLDGRDGFLLGDVGCYRTGWNASGGYQIRSGYCMGSGIGTANGLGTLQRFGLSQPVLAACGDSTFFHAAIPGLINGVWNQSNYVAVVMDNSATAMTGFQPHPGTGMTAMGEQAPPISVEAICRSIGIRVDICDPFDLETATTTLLDSIISENAGVRVVIMRRECELSRSRKEGRPYTVEVDPDKCIGDDCGCNRLCTRLFACGGLTWDQKAGKAIIDEVICAGCGYCVSVCPRGAIMKEAVVQ